MGGSVVGSIPATVVFNGAAVNGTAVVKEGKTFGNQLRRVHSLPVLVTEKHFSPGVTERPSESVRLGGRSVVAAQDSTPKIEGNNSATGDTAASTLESTPRTPAPAKPRRQQTSMIEQKDSLPLNLNPGPNRRLAPPSPYLWDQNAPPSSEESAPGIDSRSLPAAGVKSDSMPSPEAISPWQKELRAAAKKDGSSPSSSRPKLKKGGGQISNLALMVGKKQKAQEERKAKAERKATRNTPFKSDVGLLAEFEKSLRSWLNIAPRRSPAEFLRKGEGEKNRVAGTQRESKKRQELIQSERNKEPLRQAREAKRVEALKVKISENPNLELRAKLKGMKARLSAPEFYPPLTLLGDATYSRAFWAPDVSMEQPKGAPAQPTGFSAAEALSANLSPEAMAAPGADLVVAQYEEWEAVPANALRHRTDASATDVMSEDRGQSPAETVNAIVSGKQSPNARRRSLQGDEGISSASAKSEARSESGARVRRIRTRGQRNSDYLRRLSSVSTPPLAFSENLASSSETTMRRFSFSSTDSGTEAMSDDEHRASSEGRLTPVSRPGTPMQQAASAEPATPIPAVQQQQPATPTPVVQQQPATPAPAVQQPPATPNPVVQQQPATPIPVAQQQPATPIPAVQQQPATPNPVKQVSKPSLTVPATPTVKTGGWVLSADGTWKRRTSDTEERFGDKSKPVLTTWNRQLGSSVR